MLGASGRGFVPSIATLHPAVEDALRAGRALEIVRVALRLVELSLYD